jgi:hypothetical protein
MIQFDILIMQVFVQIMQKMTLFVLLEVLDFQKWPNIFKEVIK